MREKGERRDAPAVHAEPRRVYTYVSHKLEAASCRRVSHCTPIPVVRGRGGSELASVGL